VLILKLGILFAFCMPLIQETAHLGGALRRNREAAIRIRAMNRPAG
jgi:hypothetical protein